MANNRYSSLKEFYPFYLSEHQHPVSRVLHFSGTGLVLVILFIILITLQWDKLFLLPVVGYLFAWIGHFFFEKNKPATFQYPLYSLASDFILFKDLMIGKEHFFPQKK